MILRNPQALYIFRTLEKFENSLKLRFYSGNETVQSAKAPIELILCMYLEDIKSFKTA